MIKKAILTTTFALLAGTLAGCEDASHKRASASASELQTAMSFLNHPVEVNEQWRLTSSDGTRSEFLLPLGSAEAKLQSERQALKAVVLAGYGGIPKKHYDELRSAVADGRVRAGPRDKRSGLIGLDQGRNVFSVDLLGPEDVALSCEINGFHTPSFAATCQWAHDGASFSIEGSPTVISHAVIHRKALEGAWSRRVGDANGGG